MRWAIVDGDLTDDADAAVNFADKGAETEVWLNAAGNYPKAVAYWLMRISVGEIPTPH